jgi:hypothetical protein
LLSSDINVLVVTELNHLTMYSVTEDIVEGPIESYYITKGKFIVIK